MSRLPDDPTLGDAISSNAIDTIIVPRARDLGGFSVRRALPSPKRQMVGPFIFFDQVGPAEFITGEGIDVRPHPHIGLATVTYLYDGEIYHRDSLGSAQPIQPGDVNWMTAGRGITHSERTAPEVKATGSKLFGVQSWVALPGHAEETAPDFTHHAKAALPVIETPGARVRIIAGELYGAKAPTKTFSDMFYADVALEAGATIPLDAGYEERGVYTLSGDIEIAGDTFGPGQLLVFKPGDALSITARTDARFQLLGGEPMDGQRYVWWNFVSSSKERIEQAKEEWRRGRFDIVPGDEADYIPLPD
ncbi:pirin family protein [Breoghania sp. L-A4]|uniref:pirin family protein n=1 Tax=Breoghania sp. L-A4 TaxID=2304600 RepID=UPI000E358A61|nr:pirin family protein [Breoghania sp. L-A4]AXS40028.1 pirin family protein [Breoghania sp. L-A4]